MDRDHMKEAGESLWIFGYGSLVWRPAFAHVRSCAAYLTGYARRFWQGSTDHRGVPGKPGRVVTLLPDGHESLLAEGDYEPTPCWGLAYEVPVSDPEGVLEALDHRERGGYERIEVDLQLVVAEGSGTRAARGLVYVASPRNPRYLGPATVQAIASQVARARGPSGENADYVFELGRSLRTLGGIDAHVSAVEEALRGVLGESIRGGDE